MCEPHRNLSAGSPLLIENCKSMGFCTMESEGKMRYRKCRRDVQMPKQNIEAVNISAMTAEQRDAALALDACHLHIVLAEVCFVPQRGRFPLVIHHIAQMFGQQ